MVEPDPALVARLRAAGCVYAEDEAVLLADAPESSVRRRLAGEPLETILGWASFAGIRVVCAPGVFVPRLRTTLMVDLAVATVVEARAERASKPSTLLDLGCGTGAIGAAVAARVPGLDVTGVDVDPDAVACARQNLLRVLMGDLFEPVAGERFDVIAANAPYVPTEAIALMPPEARMHEHRVALDGGPDGLDVQRRAIAGSPRHLAPGGVLLVESSRAQAATTAALMVAAGMRAQVVTDDEVDGTVVVGRLEGFEPRT